MNRWGILLGLALSAQSHGANAIGDQATFTVFIKTVSDHRPQGVSPQDVFCGIKNFIRYDQTITIRDYNSDQDVYTLEVRTDCYEGPSKTETATRSGNELFNFESYLQTCREHHGTEYRQDYDGAAHNFCHYKVNDFRGNRTEEYFAGDIPFGFITLYRKYSDGSEYNAVRESRN